MTDLGGATLRHNMLREMAAFFDSIGFYLLGLIYQIFYNVATAEIFSNSTIRDFYFRFQLIIGVFMIFKLALSILQGIMDPDKAVDKKTGMGSVLVRIMTCLGMLTVLTPISVPNPSSKWEKELNNNGLLFGTMYALQNSILSNNTIGKLILGTTDNVNNDELDNSFVLSDEANQFSTTILRAFFRLNLISKEDDTEGKCYGPNVTNPEAEPDCWVCSGLDRETWELYSSSSANPLQLLSMVNLTCANDKVNQSFISGIFHTFVSAVESLAGNGEYVFSYTPIIGGIVALIFCFILLGYTVDIALRAVKLAVLRLIAPIPIIAHMNINQAKESKGVDSFSLWTKSIITTYLDLFIRLAVVYFVMFIIKDIIKNGIYITNANGSVGLLSIVLIFLGMFLFIKQAPAFFKQVLGFEGAGSNIGLSALLGGTAMAAGGGGLAGFGQGMLNGGEAAMKGIQTGKPAPLGQAWSQNSDLMAKIRTGDKEAQGGLVGRTKDYLNYKNRDRRADKLGLSNKEVAEAKYLSDQYTAKAADAQSKLEKAKIDYQNGKITDAEYQNYVDAAAFAQTAATKASKRYESMDKDRANMGAGPRIIDSRERKVGYVATRLNETLNTNIGKGTYRSPLKADTATKSPDYLGSDDTYRSEITGYKKDVKGFTGTTDDSTFASSGGGAGGPGGGPPGP